MKRQQGGWAALVILIVLVASILAALYYKHEFDAEHDKRTAAETKLTQANAQTKACNDSITGLETAAREQGAQAEKERQAATDRRKKRNQIADRELATAATTPGNDCKSAQDRVARILKERRAP